MKVSELIPSTSGIARNFGACRIVKAGSNPGSSSAGGRMNMLREKRLCQGLSGTTRPRTRDFGAAPEHRTTHATRTAPTTCLTRDRRAMKINYKKKFFFFFFFLFQQALVEAGELV